MADDMLSMLMSMGVKEKREQYKKLPFAYPGSKGEQLSNILTHIPYGTGYGEPFGGTGVVLLNRVASKLEVLNDRYSGITDFFRVVRDKVLYPQFMERIAATVHSREEFMWCKRTWKELIDDPVERAARWYYTIRFAVNCRIDSTFGRSTNPIVRFADRLHKSLPLFGPLHYRLHTVTMENQDWRHCLEDYDQKGFIWYMDPTYLDCSPGMYDHELSIEDHKELITRIPTLQGFVAVSSYDGPQTMAIYDVPGVWDDVITWDRTSRANTQVESCDRIKVKEKLWIRHAR